MEYRDLYDINRMLTGEKIKKGENVPKNRYYVTVVIFIQNNKGEFLLQINKKHDMWSTTGGHPKSGESSIESIAAEMKEELGYIVVLDKIKLIKTYQSEDDFVDLYYYNEDIDIKKLKLQEEEVDCIDWFNNEQIEKLIKDNNFLPPHIEYYRDCLKYLKNEIIIK